MFKCDVQNHILTFLNNIFSILKIKVLKLFDNKDANLSSSNELNENLINSCNLCVLIYSAFTNHVSEYVPYCNVPKSDHHRCRHTFFIFP